MPATARAARRAFVTVLLALAAAYGVRDPRVTRWSREKPSAPQVCFRGERPAEEGGPEREGSGKRRGLKSALRDTKFVLFCARRSPPSVPEPESELLSLLDS